MKDGNTHSAGKGDKWRETNFKKYRENWPLGEPNRELNKKLRICFFCQGQGKTTPNKNNDIFDPCPICQGSGEITQKTLKKINHLTAIQIVHRKI